MDNRRGGGRSRSSDAGGSKREKLWQKLDPGTTGFAEIKKFVQYAEDVNATCPGLIDKFSELAKDGHMEKAAFMGYGSPGKSGRTGRNTRRARPQRDMGLLRQLFDSIVQVGHDELRLADLVRHKNDVNRICPELITEFEEIDIDNSCTVSWDELRVFAGGTDDWLKFQLDSIIGLDSLKDQIYQFHQSISLDKKRQAAGFDVKNSGGKYHMIFQGNPGTGKTTLGRVVAALLKRIGITATDTLVEVQRDQLVAGYVGQTATKTQEKIDEAKDGVLFVDEAYRLSGGGGKDFGNEAIETIMGAMNEPPGKAPVMVFAGYPDDMAQFMQANSGLYRRIAYTFDFDDYTPLDLAKILEKMSVFKGFHLALELTANGFEVLAQMIEHGTLPAARSLMNGGICEHIYTFAKQALDARCQALGDVSVEICAEDITVAMARIPPPPGRDHGSYSAPNSSGGGDGGGSSSEDRVGPELVDIRSELGRVEQKLRAAEADNAILKQRLKQKLAPSTQQQQQQDNAGDCAAVRDELAQEKFRADTLQAQNDALQQKLASSPSPQQQHQQYGGASGNSAAVRAELAQEKIRADTLQAQNDALQQNLARGITTAEDSTAVQAKLAQEKVRSDRLQAQNDLLQQKLARGITTAEDSAAVQAKLAQEKVRSDGLQAELARALAEVDRLSNSSTPTTAAAVSSPPVASTSGGTWEVLLPGGWANMDAATQRLVNDATKDGKTSVSVKIAGRAYLIDLRAKKQTNRKTGKARDIRLHSSGPSPSSSLASLPQMSQNARGASWQVLLDDNNWKAMDQKTSELLTDAASSGLSSVDLRMRGFNYTINLIANTQTNLKTNAVRQIKFE